jgi:hypothetical protein
VSDGKFTPEEIKKMYMERGYSAVAYTDHRVCKPHNELTDGSFVALTGVEIAFGIRQASSIHVCGISRNPDKELLIENEIKDDVELVNNGIKELNRQDFITTLNHPRWSGMSAEVMSKIEGVSNMEVANGFEMIQDGYGDSSACYELELRRGRHAAPFATDDSHTASAPGVPGYEYFRGFTVIKAKELTYEALISALDSGDYYASTGPILKNLRIEDGILYVECSAVSGVYVHGELYSHRAALIKGDDCIEYAELNVEKILEGSKYLFVQIVDREGKRAWSAPYYIKGEDKSDV